MRPVNEFLRDPNNANFLKTFANKLHMLRLLNELAAGGPKAALKIFAEKQAEDFIEQIFENSAPAFGKALGWFAWAKTGMELTKKFVYDPAVEQLNIGLYCDCRKNGLEPEDAFACIRSYGNVRLAALEEFKKESSPLRGPTRGGDGGFWHVSGVPLLT
jgi:hypothetical protein